MHGSLALCNLNQNHQVAASLFASTDPQLFITSDYVLDESLTFDEHFREFGNVAVLP